MRNFDSLFFSNKSPDFVRLGDQNLFDAYDGAEPVDYQIKNFVKHEKYDSSEKLNDIALVELEKSVKFTAFIRPACLIDSNYVGKVIAVRWIISYHKMNFYFWFSF